MGRGGRELQGGASSGERRSSEGGKHRRYTGHASLRNPTGPSNVIVVLDFMPDRFDSERIRENGAFAGRDGTLNRIRLRNVSPDNLRRLAGIAWVSRIEPMR